MPSSLHEAPKRFLVRIALLAVALPFVGALPHSVLYNLDAEYLSTWDKLTSLVLLPMGLILTGYPQLGMYFVVKSLQRTLAIAIGTASSVALGIWYAVWAYQADFSGSSTASLALPFYPIMVQGWAWLGAISATLLTERILAKAQ